ncbi:MAG: P-type conjugative transfer protein TrbG, partial [Bryobacteraceae bacterium]
MHSFKLITIAATLSAGLLAQDSPAPPVQAKRLPPEKSKRKVPPGNDTVLDRYDFGAQINALQDMTSLKPGAQTVKPILASTTSSLSNGESAVPAGFKPKTDVQLTKTAQEAVQMSEKWMSEHNQPAVGHDGRVLYSYGAGLPTVVCAPLRVCMIELQPGEKIVGEPQIGDSVRWNLSPAMYGSGVSSTPVIVLKPQGPGLDTNLLITTDRRAYYLRLLSKADDYVARVAFAYPDDEENERKWRQHLAEQKNQQAKSTRIAELPPNAVDSMFFNYRVKGDDSIRPVRVFDDGKKTYIQISRTAKNREAPVLVVIGADGKQEMVNYRVKDDMYIVDRLFDKAQ